MKVEGYLSGAAGLLLTLYAGLVYDVSVSPMFGEREIINIGLQQNRLLLFAFGAVLMLAGVILLVGGRLEERLPPLPADAGTAPPELSAEPRDGSANPIGHEADPEWLEAEMARLGVIRDGERFAFGAYRYDRIEDALAYASQHAGGPERSGVG